MAQKNSQTICDSPVEPRCMGFLFHPFKAAEYPATQVVPEKSLGLIKFATLKEPPHKLQFNRQVIWQFVGSRIQLKPSSTIGLAHRNG